MDRRTIRATIFRRQQRERQRRRCENITRHGCRIFVIFLLVAAIFQYTTNRLFPNDASRIIIPHTLKNRTTSNIPPPPPPPPLNNPSPPPPPNSSRIAICLFGEGRHFDLTAASILKNVVQEHPNADLFVVSPLDLLSYKLLLLGEFPRLASIDIKEHSRHYIQQQRYCLKVVLQHEGRDGFEYDWIVMTRTDGYWSGPLAADVFVPDRYVVLDNSHPVGGLSEKFAVANRNLMVRMVRQGWDLEVGLYSQKAVPMCMVSDRVGVVSSMGRSKSGEECRPCRSFKSCGGFWQRGWEAIFDEVAGEEAARMRKKIWEMNAEYCEMEWKLILGTGGEQTLDWDIPDEEQLCTSLPLV